MSSIRRRVELAKALQIVTCRSRISFSSFWRFFTFAIGRSLSVAPDNGCSIVPLSMLSPMSSAQSAISSSPTWGIISIGSHCSKGTEVLEQRARFATSLHCAHLPSKHKNVTQQKTASQDQYSRAGREHPVEVNLLMRHQNWNQLPEL